MLLFLEDEDEISDHVKYYLYKLFVRDEYDLDDVDYLKTNPDDLIDLILKRAARKKQWKFLAKALDSTSWYERALVCLDSNQAYLLKFLKYCERRNSGKVIKDLLERASSHLMFKLFKTAIFFLTKSSIKYYSGELSANGQELIHAKLWFILDWEAFSLTPWKAMNLRLPYGFWTLHSHAVGISK